MSAAPSASSIVEWLDHGARKWPQRAAAEDASGRSITYGEMAALTRRVSGRLVAEGVRPGDRVGVCMRKSIDSLVAFQAVLRTGAAYVPTDPLAPAGRTATAFHDCEATAALVDEELSSPVDAECTRLGARPCLLPVPAKAPAGCAWRIEAWADASAGASQGPRRRDDDLAFLLYTSGSTGQPKAVRLTHRNVISFVDWCSAAFAPTERDKFATHAPLHFSLSVFSLYVAWKHAGTVVLIDEQTARVPELLAPLIDARGVTVWFSAPKILSLLVQSERLLTLKLAALRLVMFGGEPFPIPDLRRLRSQIPHARYLHILGSTETHMIASYELPPGVPAAGDRTVPIGTVGSHFRSRIVDERDNEVVPGSEGELVLAGPPVTPGYWRPVAERSPFFADAGGETWYRTGDIVVAGADGQLVHRGRRDRRIKKRGHRVELGEIEACLRDNSGVTEAAVVAVPDDALGMKVTAFVVPRADERPTVIGLKAHCARALPAYMVPDVVAFGAALPRTSTGKVDLPALQQLV